MASGGGGSSAVMSGSEGTIVKPEKQAAKAQREFHESNERHVQS